MTQLALGIDPQPLSMAPFIVAAHELPPAAAANFGGMSAVAVLACGALATHVRQVARGKGWAVDVHPLPALLHNRPSRIPGEVEYALERLADRYDAVAVACADCGMDGALDAVLAAAGVQRLAGEHCYDVLGREEVRAALAQEPGTSVLTGDAGIERQLADLVG